THGILAMLVLPLLLAGAMMLWHRCRGGSVGASASSDKQPRITATPVAGAGENSTQPRALLSLAFLAIVYHPLLDWMNNYVVHLLMPFDGRWFYGDTLFIVDRWFWLLAAVGVVLARSASRRAIAGWLLLGAIATGLVLGTNLVPPGVKIVWAGGVAVVIALRWLRPSWASSTTLARAGLLSLTLYMGAAYALGRIAESTLLSRYPDALQAQANPAPAVPGAHRLVLTEEDRYRILTADGAEHEVPREDPDAIVRAKIGRAH